MARACAGVTDAASFFAAANDVMETVAATKRKIISRRSMVCSEWFRLAFYTEALSGRASINALDRGCLPLAIQQCRLGPVVAHERHERPLGCRKPVRFLV